MRPTTPAPERQSSGTAPTNPTTPGTIGFDIYLALFVPRSALMAPRVPQDLGKLLDYQA